jgi:succinate-semialdehyde dehydrogenase / glutarate-semialdehyde dehydrogenase
MEVMAAADIIDWFAEEGRRAYGRVIPARAEASTSSWSRSRSARSPPSRPGTSRSTRWCASSRRGRHRLLDHRQGAGGDAGLPRRTDPRLRRCRRCRPGVSNLVYGVPAEISEYLIPHPVIRKVTFTGSTPVGKLLAALAGQHMKRVTMELGGHAPAIVFDDADLDLAAKTLAAAKFRNAGQVCVAHALPGAGEALRPASSRSSSRTPRR